MLARLKYRHYGNVITLPSLVKINIHLLHVIQNRFLLDPGVPGVRPSVTPTPFADLTDVTLADEDSNTITTDDVNSAILGNVAMQVAPPGGQN